MRFQIQQRTDRQTATKMFYVIEKVVYRHSGKYGYDTRGKFQTREEAEAAIKAIPRLSA